jgi:hypothetical protein
MKGTIRLTPMEVGPAPSSSRTLLWTAWEGVYHRSGSMLPPTVVSIVAFVISAA